MLNSHLEIVHVSRDRSSGRGLHCKFVGKLLARATRCPESWWAKVISPIKLHPEPGSTVRKHCFSEMLFAKCIRLLFRDYYSITCKSMRSMILTTRKYRSFFCQNKTMIQFTTYSHILLRDCSCVLNSPSLRNKSRLVLLNIQSWRISRENLTRSLA